MGVLMLYGKPQENHKDIIYFLRIFLEYTANADILLVYRGLPGIGSQILTY